MTPTKTAATPTAAVPALVDMLEAGVHFGHERSKKNPRMDKYIFMLRNRMAIIDLEKTHAALTSAVDFLQTICQDPGKKVLFIGTKRQARDIVRKHAEDCAMPYVTTRWLGGTLTNFPTILKSIEKLEELKSMAGTPAWDKMTKKEKAVHGKERQRLEEILEGIKDLKKLPDVVVAVGVHDERLAVREARRVGIPVVGLTDTNADPSLADYPIPANDDAIRSLDIILGTLTAAIKNPKPAKKSKP